MPIQLLTDHDGREYATCVGGYPSDQRFYFDELRRSKESAIVTIGAQIKASRSFMERQFKEETHGSSFNEWSLGPKGDWLHRLRKAIKHFDVALAYCGRELRRRDWEHDRENEKALNRRLNKFWQKHQERMAAEYVPPAPKLVPVAAPAVLPPSAKLMQQGMDQLREQRDLMLKEMNECKRRYDVLLDLLADELGDKVAGRFDADAEEQASWAAAAAA